MINCKNQWDHNGPVSFEKYSSYFQQINYLFSKHKKKCKLKKAATKLTKLLHQIIDKSSESLEYYSYLILLEFGTFFKYKIVCFFFYDTNVVF